MRASATAEELAELRSKYAEMLRMRLADETEPRAARRSSMAALARRFPGALREIDELPLDEIRRRIDALELASGDPAIAAAWMIAVARFHALARGALEAKRWLGRTRLVDESVLRAFEEHASSCADAASVRAWAPHLPGLAKPPRGRVMEVVYERLADMLGVSVSDARHLVFGPSRRERRSGASSG